MIVAAAATTAMTAAGLRVARFLAASRCKGGKLLGNFRGTTVRTFAPLPIGGADEDFAVMFALVAMKFVNRHEVTLFRRAEITSAGFDFWRQNNPNRRARPVPDTCCSRLDEFYNCAILLLCKLIFTNGRSKIQFS
jgi:hypothetical protein